MTREELLEAKAFLESELHELQLAWEQYANGPDAEHRLVISAMLDVFDQLTEVLKQLGEPSPLENFDFEGAWQQLRSIAADETASRFESLVPGDREGIVAFLDCLLERVAQRYNLEMAEISTEEMIQTVKRAITTYRPDRHPSLAAYAEWQLLRLLRERLGYEPAI